MHRKPTCPTLLTQGLGCCNKFGVRFSRKAADEMVDPSVNALVSCPAAWTCRWPHQELGATTNTSNDCPVACHIDGIVGKLAAGQLGLGVLQGEFWSKPYTGLSPANFR